jgi:hypothetical protein
MAHRDSRRSDASEGDSPWFRSRGLPAWLLSCGLHFTVLLTLGVVIRPRPQGAADEPRRDGGIVLVNRAAGKAEYFSDDRDSGSASSAASSAAIQAQPNPFPASDQPPVVAGPKLPTDRGPLSGSAPPSGSALPSAGALTTGGGKKGGPLGRGDDYGVETQVFGVKGKGSRFVYVFDRSASMSGFEGRPLAAAKRELIASLQSLQGVNQFQIIFYNENPRMMNLVPGQQPQMLFGDDEGKRQAESFVSGIHADGGTSHMKALTLALRMGPDVIFFLTDADEPQLRNDELARIRRLNRGTVINAIEFGAGSSTSRYSFLKRLAAENDGQHGYVDVTRLPR